MPARPERAEAPEAARPERAEAPSPGQHPGLDPANNKVALKGQKHSHQMLLPFQGDFLYIPYTQGATLG